MKIGYARVSKFDQNPDLQINALKAAGCEEIVFEQASTRKGRPELSAALERLAEGDSLVVWRFDRLARSVSELVAIIEQVKARSAHLESLTEKIDTNTSMGQMTFHVIAAIAQFERDLIRERTIAGQEAARERGKHPGRPKALTNAQIELAAQMRANGQGLREIARSFRVAPSTISAALTDDE
jgi:DNA invertase Pin-like site-specific DNA recombinase